VTALFQFVKARYPSWELPTLFLQTKCLSGCRLYELCSVRSEDLKDGAVHFTAAYAKGRRHRQVVLPPDLYRALDAQKGKEYLWEHFTQERRKHVGENGKLRGRVRPFDPTALHGFFQRLLRAFQMATGKKLSFHLLRRRTITKLYAAGLRPDQIAEMLGFSSSGFRCVNGMCASAPDVSSVANTLIPTTPPERERTTSRAGARKTPRRNGKKLPPTR